MRVPVVDAHLDIAWNVLSGRDYDATAAEVREREGSAAPTRCMVTLRELARGDVAVAFATLFTGTNTYEDDGRGIYDTAPDEDARRQLDVYLGWEEAEKVRIIRDTQALDSHLDAWEQDGKLGIVVLIEGGDSITTPAELPVWWDAGVRIIGPAWSATRYCGGTRRPGGLTDLGAELVVAMRELGFVLDASHLAEQAFWDAIDLGPGRIIASHSNARAIVPGGRLITGDRQLSDDMIRAIGDADGVIGLNLFNGFLVPEWEPAIIGKLIPSLLAGPPAVMAENHLVTLDDVRAHAAHIADLIGWSRVGIGSDLDGGLGADETPAELDTAADLAAVGEVAPPEARSGLVGANWLRLLRAALPG
ncbi:MAG: dipeptidase [Actinomycetota bacterium]